MFRRAKVKIDEKRWNFLEKLKIITYDWRTGQKCVSFLRFSCRRGFKNWEEKSEQNAWATEKQIHKLADRQTTEQWVDSTTPNNWALEKLTGIDDYKRANTLLCCGCHGCVSDTVHHNHHRTPPSRMPQWKGSHSWHEPKRRSLLNDKHQNRHRYRDAHTQLMPYTKDTAPT